MLGQRSQRRWRSWIAAALVGVVTFVGLVVILSAFRSDRPTQVRPITVASGEWAPFMGSDLPDDGPVARVMTEVLGSVGYAPEISFSSWASVDARTASGAVFGGYPLVASADRAERMLVSDPILDFDYVLFVRADDETMPTSAADLESLNIGGIVGYDYWAEFESDAGEIERFETPTEGLIALHEGRIDVFAEGEASGFAALADADLSFDASAVAVVPSTEEWARSTQHLYFMMQPTSENERVLETINDALADVRDTASYREMLAEIAPQRSGGEDVVLVGRDAGAVALRDDNGDIIAYTPRGVHARVLAWPESLDGAQPPLDTATASVKLQDGPYAGRIFAVSVNDLEVTE